jgi:AraC family transcriptional regulator of arabinose operon
MTDFACIHFPRQQHRGAMQLHRLSKERWQPGHAIEKKDRENHVLFYVISGTGQYLSPQRHCVVQAGDIAAFAPGGAHGLRAHAGEPLVLYRATVVGTACSALFHKTFGAGFHVCSLKESHRVADVFRFMLAEAKAARPFHRELLEQYYLVLLTLIKQSATSHAAPTPAKELWAKAKTLMETRFHEPISVEQIAAACACSPEHLARTCRKLNLDTPYQYLTKLRMNHAANILRENSHTLYQIALQCGYSDEHAFSKAFKRYYHQSPGTWRKNLL